MWLLGWDGELIMWTTQEPSRSFTFYHVARPSFKYIAPLQLFQIVMSAAGTPFLVLKLNSIRRNLLHNSGTKRYCKKAWSKIQIAALETSTVSWTIHFIQVLFPLRISKLYQYYFLLDIESFGLAIAGVVDTSTYICTVKTSITKVCKHYSLKKGSFLD